jgi:multiple sugar transport system permease protein
MRSLSVVAPAAPPRRRLFLTPYLFVLPAALLFVVFMLYPLADAFRISLYDWKIVPGATSPFVGVDNYTRAFQDEVFWIALRNTALYTAITVPAQMILAMLVALALDAVPRGRVLFRVLYYLPVITSWVVVSLLFRYLFDSGEGGIVNYFLTNVLHVTAEPIPWLREAGPALIAIMALGVWKGIGWSMVIFLAALQGIPLELYEAAMIDGANGWQRFWRITLPMIRPTIVFVLVLLIIGGFNVFISVYLMTGGNPLHRTETMLTYMYNQAFNFLEFGYGAALSYILAAIIFIVSFVQIKFLRDPVEV